jgi:hypothetical protein
MCLGSNPASEVHFSISSLLNPIIAAQKSSSWHAPQKVVNSTRARTFLQPDQLAKERVGGHSPMI